MKHFVLSAAPNAEGIIRLYEKDYHYLVNVRRLGEGSSFDAVLPGGAETAVRILSTADNILIGECTGAKEAPSLIPPVALFQGLPRGSKMDLIVRQAAEGGIAVIVPFESEYSTVRLNKSGDQKLPRWERIVKEARQQSGSVIETRVRPPVTFGEALLFWESIKKSYRRPVGILLHQEPLGNGTFHGYLDNSPDFAALAVGPEGGFSPGELSAFAEAGFKPALMGTTVLRTETAALYGAAAIRIILLESKFWSLGNRQN